MGRIKLFLFLIVSVALLVLADPALAGNKFTTISGGVSGVDLKKLALLKDISGYAGGVMLVISLAALLTRRRHGGDSMSANKKNRMDTSIIAPLILSGIGLIFIIIYFI